MTFRKWPSLLQLSQGTWNRTGPSERESFLEADCDKGSTSLALLTDKSNFKGGRVAFCSTSGDTVHHGGECTVADGDMTPTARKQRNMNDGAQFAFFCLLGLGHQPRDHI